MYIQNNSPCYKFVRLTPCFSVNTKWHDGMYRQTGIICRFHWIRLLQATRLKFFFTSNHMDPSGNTRPMLHQQEIMPGTHIFFVNNWKAMYVIFI